MYYALFYGILLKTWITVFCEILRVNTLNIIQENIYNFLFIYLIIYQRF